MFPGCFIRVSRIFLGNFKSASKVVERKFVIQVSFKVVSGMLQGCVKKVLRGLHESSILISQCFRVV